jgi:hypothetical protein
MSVNIGSPVTFVLKRLEIRGCKGAKCLVWMVIICHYLPSRLSQFKIQVLSIVSAVGVTVQHYS